MQGSMSIPFTQPDREHPVLLVARAAVLEFCRRKDAYVLLIITGLYLVGALCARAVGVDSTEAIQFLLNLGLTACFWSAAALTIVAGGRQVPMEIETRTLYTLLARPVSRGQVLVGKWLAVTLAGTLTLGILFLLTILAVNPHPGMSLPLLAQGVVLQAAALGVLAALVMLLTLIAPKAVALMIAVAVYFAGGPLVGFAAGRLEGGSGTLLAWCLGYLPNFGLLNVAQRFTDGGPPLGSLHLAGLLAYAGVFAGLYLLAAKTVFERRSF